MVVSPRCLERPRRLRHTITVRDDHLPAKSSASRLSGRCYIGGARYTIYNSSRSAFANLIARGLHGLDDVLIAGAAAQVRGEHVEQFLVVDVWVFLQHVSCQHQKARRAVAALQS